MERPGLLEFAVYALVLVAAGGWVYALPPFTNEPGGRPQSASTVPSGDPGENGDAQAITIVSTNSQGQSDPDDRSNVDPRPNLLVVTARSLNMRSEPDAGSALVGSYPRGAVVEKMETSGNWVRVRTEDDATGWMYAGYLGAAQD